MTVDGLTLRALSEELDATLRAHRLQRIHHPCGSRFTLELWSPRDRQERLLLMEIGPRPRLHLTRARFQNPPTPSPFCMLLRKHLKGGQVEAVRQLGWERLVDVLVRRRERVYRLRAELLGHHGALVLLDAQGTRVLGAWSAGRGRLLRPGAAYTPPPAQGKLDPLAPKAEEAFFALDLPAGPVWRGLLARLEGIGPRLARELCLRTGLDPQAPQLPPQARAALWAAIVDLFRRAASSAWEPGLIVQEGKALDAAPFPLKLYESCAWQPTATLSEACDALLDPEVFTAEEEALRARLLHQVRRRLERTRTALARVEADRQRAADHERFKREADLILLHLSALKGVAGPVDLEDPATGERVRIQLDPRLSPSEAAQRRYARYKKLKRGLDKLAARRAQLQDELAALETAEVQVSQAETVADLAELAEALGLGAAPSGRRPPAVPTGPRRVTCEGYVILIGKNARQNDQLVREAQDEDLWLHARGRPGSHVVVRTRGNAAAVPEAVRLRAARLAAYYSQGRNATKVPVICTRAKFLRKPQGAPAGTVRVTREEANLLVRPAPEEMR